MTTQLKIAKDPGSVATYITEFSDSRAALVLTADTDATVPVPIDARFAVFYYDTGKDVWVSEAVITLPVNDTPITNAGVLLKPSLNVQSLQGTNLHFFCNETAFVCVEFYR